MAHHPRARRFGGFLSVLVVLLVIVVGVGFWQGWFSLSSGDVDGRTDVTLSVDEEKIERDTGAALDATRREAREVGEKIKAASDITSVEGVVESVDAQERSVTVRTEDDGVQTFRVVDDTELSRDDEPTQLSGISAGDQVIVVFREGEQRRVDSITVVEPEGSDEPARTKE